MSLIIFFVDELLSSDGTHSGTFDELTSIKYQFVALKDIKRISVKLDH